MGPICNSQPLGTYQLQGKKAQAALTTETGGRWRGRCRNSISKHSTAKKDNQPQKHNKFLSTSSSVKRPDAGQRAEVLGVSLGEDASLPGTCQGRLAEVPCRQLMHACLQDRVGVGGECKVLLWQVLSVLLGGGRRAGCARRGDLHQVRRHCLQGIAGCPSSASVHREAPFPTAPPWTRTLCKSCWASQRHCGGARG